MNANELADELEKLHQQDLIDGVADLAMPEAAAMLRQQQAEIKALKKLVSEMKYEKSSGVYEMNNVPVAWMHHCLKSGIGYLSYTKPPPLDDYKPIPLYTHPVKELTDAEIIKLFENDELWTRSSIVYQDDAINFARAILRKAQEK